MATVPSDATHGVQSSFRELNEELRKLRSEISQINTETIRKKVEDAQKDITDLQHLRRIPATGQRAFTGSGTYFLDDRLNWSPMNGDVSFRSVTTSDTVNGGDHVIFADATGGNVTLTLPAAANGNQVLWIKKTDASANLVIIDGSGSETIDGAATLTLPLRYNCVGIISDGTNWGILSAYDGY